MTQMTRGWNYLEASSFLSLAPLLVGIKRWAHPEFLARSSIHSLSLANQEIILGGIIWKVRIIKEQCSNHMAFFFKSNLKISWLIPTTFYWLEPMIKPTQDIWEGNLDSTSWSGIGKALLQRSMWDTIYCFQLWKIQSATSSMRKV